MVNCINCGNDPCDQSNYNCPGYVNPFSTLNFSCPTCNNDPCDNSQPGCPGYVNPSPAPSSGVSTQSNTGSPSTGGNNMSMAKIIGGAVAAIGLASLGAYAGCSSGKASGLEEGKQAGIVEGTKVGDTTGYARGLAEMQAKYSATGRFDVMTQDRLFDPMTGRELPITQLDTTVGKLRLHPVPVTAPGGRMSVKGVDVGAVVWEAEIIDSLKVPQGPDATTVQYGNDNRRVRLVYKDR